MSGHFPSSPVTSAAQSLPSFEEHSFGKKQLQYTNRAHEYPTPVPSSSTGQVSSPVKRSTVIYSDPESSFLLDYEDDDLKAGEEEEEEVIEEENEDKLIKTVNHTKVNIEFQLNPHGTPETIFGRKSKWCDVVLPKNSLISRRHIVLSYIPLKNQVKIKCIGLNGIVVALPRRIGCDLIQRNPDKPIYELTSSFNGINAVAPNKKELVKNKQLTSFVLLPNETIMMPFIKDTILDFKQVEVKLGMKQLDYSEEEQSEVEEKTETDIQTSEPQQLIESFHVPSIPIIQQNITPHSSFNMEVPNAPKKSSKNELLDKEKTPVPVSLKNHKKLKKLHDKSNSFSHSSSLKFSGDEESRHQHKNKVRKVMKEQKQKMSTEDILDSLTKRGIDYIDLQNVLSNHLAFANVQQTPLSQLNDVNSTVRGLSKEELRTILNDELSIGVIYRQGKDAAGKPLDEEYYYDLENDPNEERKSLVTSLKGGRSGLRSCRRTHKQYFWKKPAK